MGRKVSFKENKGITLVALVVTIIVLIILAAVSINLVLGENGIVTKAKDGAQNYQIAANEEAGMLANIESIIDSNISGNGGESGTPQKQALKDKITSANYGDKVNYSVTVNGVTLGDGKNEDNTNNDLDCWKIFYKDPNTNEVIMIYGDYLPNTTNLAIDAGLKLGTGGYATYGVQSKSTRADLLDNLKDSSKWTSLLTSTLSSKGCTAKGTIDLETWVASWNAKGYTKLYTQYTTDTTKWRSEGYLVGTNTNPTSYYQDVNDTDGYRDKLYFPYQSDQTSCYGYWLTSPSPIDSWYEMSISSGGTVDGGYFEDNHVGYLYAGFGIRPVISLSPSVSTSGQDASGVWNIE